MILFFQILGGFAVVVAWWLGSFKLSTIIMDKNYVYTSFFVWIVLAAAPLIAFASVVAAHAP